MNTMRNLSRWVGAGVGMMIFAQAFSGFAATTNVLVGAGGTLTFSPNNVKIAVGDQIIWTWQGNFHSTTSTNASGTILWDSTVSSQPHSFTNTFNAAGSFPFFCSVHGGSPFFMTGVVSVAQSDLPPTVSITNPVNNATFSAPASFTLAATASDADGTVTNVQFFQGAASLGNVATSPYAVPVNSLSAADYTFSAVATDNGGLTATNAITLHVVTPLPIVLTAPQFLSLTDFRFNYTANPGLTYLIQRASSLSSGIWTTLGTNQAGGTSVIFDDPAATGSPAFYRVGLLPNP
jgi:plastocyanin